MSIHPPVPQKQQSQPFWVPGVSLMEDNLFMDQDGGGIWGMFKYIVFIVCFISKLLYIVIYNEIIIHLMECRISGSSKFVFLQPDSPIWG